jgi:acetyl esterase/lipase
VLVALALSLLIAGPDSSVVYSRPAGTDLRMDIYRPSSASSPTAAVLLIHGGAWMTGDRTQMATLGEAIAREGMLAATIDYRLAPTHLWPAMLDDAQTAVRYLRSKAKELNIDPNRIGAAGASAGGQMALLLGSLETRDPKTAEYPAFSSRVGAVLDIFGPADMSRDFPPEFDVLCLYLLGKPKDQAADEIKALSPMTHVTRSSAPTFILHGKMDRLVPYGQSERLAAKLKSLGVHTEIVLIEKMGHEVDVRRPGVLSAFKRGIAFLKANLAPAAAIAR